MSEECEAVRVRDHSQDGQADRSDHSAECARAGGHGDQVIEENEAAMLGLN